MTQITFDDLVRENKFKQTEIGLIPEDWEVVRLGEIIRYKKGKKPRKLSKIWKDRYFPYLTAEFFRTGRPKEFVDYNTEHGIEIVEPEDIVLIWDGSNAGDVFTGLKGVLASTMVKIDVKKDYVSKKFIYYFLKTKFDVLNSKTTGSTIPHVSKTVFENLPIPLPPLPEQQKIAKVLDKIQQAIEIQDRIIEQAKNLKKSLMQKLFTEGLYGEEQKEREIGLIPKSWEVVRLGELHKRKIIKFQNGFACGKWNENGIGIPQIRPFNITNEGRIRLENLKYIQPNMEIEKYKLKKGDVIFNNTNSEELVGRTAYWDIDGDFTLSNHMTIIRILNRNIINPLFLASYLHKNWIDGVYLKHRRRYVNQASITLTVLKSFKIPLPPLEEQKQIAHILSTVDKKIEVEQKRKQILKELFKTMLHKLMSGEIRLKEVEI